MTHSSTSRRLLAGVALTAVLVAVAGCGRRGPLEPPPGAVTAPKAASAERIVAPATEVSTSDFGKVENDREIFVQDPGRDGQTQPVQTTAAPVDPNAPRKPFFLDSLVK